MVRKQGRGLRIGEFRRLDGQGVLVSGPHAEGWRPWLA